ncbi:hypothetical protein QE152_g29590 [Popillia japonica]|uniref:Uncharacterized protein n=1 Tax=Popillia japonica TaxID=7064 RepID=A0AAW1JHI3_POPJA
MAQWDRETQDDGQATDKENLERQLEEALVFGRRDSIVRTPPSQMRPTRQTSETPPRDASKGSIDKRRCTWRRLLHATRRPATPQHAHSAASTDTDLTTIDTHELWIQETEPAPCTMSALGQFGAEMLKLSRGLEAASNNASRNCHNSSNQSSMKNG